MVYKNEATPDNRMITVDRERGITLQSRPAGPDGVYPFSLDWEGLKIPFAAEIADKKRYQDEQGAWRFDYTWLVRAIDLPEGFSESEEKLFSVISEAIDACGLMHSRARVGQVIVNFAPGVFTSKGYL